MARTAKNKGRLGQNEIRDKLLEAFPEFEPDDIKSTTMGDTGEDIQLSPAVRKKLPITIEVKRRKAALKTVYDFLIKQLTMVKVNLLCSLGLTVNLGLL